MIIQNKKICRFRAIFFKIDCKATRITPLVGLGEIEIFYYLIMKSLTLQIS